MPPSQAQHAPPLLNKPHLAACAYLGAANCRGEGHDLPAAAGIQAAGIAAPRGLLAVQAVTIWCAKRGSSGVRAAGVGGMGTAGSQVAVQGLIVRLGAFRHTFRPSLVGMRALKARFCTREQITSCGSTAWYGMVGLTARAPACESNATVPPGVGLDGAEPDAHSSRHAHALPLKSCSLERRRTHSHELPISEPAGRPLPGWQPAHPRQRVAHSCGQQGHSGAPGCTGRAWWQR